MIRFLLALLPILYLGYVIPTVGLVFGSFLLITVYTRYIWRWAVRYERARIRRLCEED